jgi:hypothetical protein
MATVTSTSAEARGSRPVGFSRPVPTCLLAYTDPTGPGGPYGPGWTLVIRPRSDWSWSIGLDAHGAGPDAAASLAEAVAARVLVGQGTDVVDWAAAGDDEPAAFLATAILAARCPPGDEPVGAHGRWPGH